MLRRRKKIDGYTDRCFDTGSEQNVLVTPTPASELVIGPNPGRPGIRVCSGGSRGGLQGLAAPVPKAQGRLWHREMKIAAGNENSRPCTEGADNFQLPIPMTTSNDNFRLHSPSISVLSNFYTERVVWVPSHQQGRPPDPKRRHFRPRWRRS